MTTLSNLWTCVHRPLRHLHLLQARSNQRMTRQVEGGIILIAMSLLMQPTQNTGATAYSATQKHPLYVCPKFKDKSHAEKLITLKSNNLCKNCSGGGHFAHNCRSLYKCKMCQRSHHTLLHMENKPESELQLSSNAAVRLKSSLLLMTCRVIVTVPSCAAIEARAFLDNEFSASFIKEHLAQSLKLHRSQQNIHVSGITGVSPKSLAHSVVSLQVSPSRSFGNSVTVSAILYQRSRVNSTSLQLNWIHIGPIWLIYHWLIRTTESLVELISYLVSRSLLIYCSMAGSLDHLDPPG